MLDAALQMANYSAVRPHLHLGQAVPSPVPSYLQPLDKTLRSKRPDIIPHRKQKESETMISAEYCRLMSRYNTWQNTSLVTAADGLTEIARHKDRGAFFKSIAATLNHLYWADALILQRLKGNERPEKTITHSLTSPSDWNEFKALRSKRDEEIEEWAARLGDADLDGMVIWYPGDGSTRIEKPKTLCAAELFNHQTHHRGQIHAMLTAAAAEPEPTDLSMLP